MPVDPELAEMLAAVAAEQVPGLLAGPAVQARARGREVRARFYPPILKSIRNSENLVIPGPAGDIAARLYRPEAKVPLPTVVYFHGGGWIIGDLDSHDRSPRGRPIARHPRSSRPW
jgi:acetyl esterase